MQGEADTEFAGSQQPEMEMLKGDERRCRAEPMLGGLSIIITYSDDEATDERRVRQTSSLAYGSIELEGSWASMSRHRMTVQDLGMLRHSANKSG